MSWTWVDQGKAKHTRVYLHCYRMSNITTTWAICSLMMVITSQVTQPSIVWTAIMIRHRTARKIWFTSNLLSSAKKLNGEWCKVRLNQGQRWQICKLVRKCGIYHLCLWFLPRFLVFVPSLPRTNLCKSNFSCSVVSKLVKYDSNCTWRYKKAWSYYCIATRSNPRGWQVTV